MCSYFLFFIVFGHYKIVDHVTDIWTTKFVHLLLVEIILLCFLVHPTSWITPPVANCFATDRSKAVTPMVLVFVNCLWCLIWNWYLFLYTFSLRGEFVFSECGDSGYAYFSFFSRKCIVYHAMVFDFRYQVKLKL
jgi:hypothetical protein